MKPLLKAGICGHFGGGESFSDGQTVKTIIMTEKLKEMWGPEQVLALDTFQWKKHIFKLIFQCLHMLKSCENILVLPSWNGVKVFIPLFLFFNKLYHRKLHYVIIGSWLPDVLKECPSLLNKMTKLNGLYGETVSLTEELKALNLSNVYLLPNFKKLDITDEISYKPDYPLALYTFSRIIKPKGIYEAAEAVRITNEKLGKIAYTLDIWGDIHPSYAEEFKKLCAGFPAYITYKGCLSYEDTTDTLKKYFALLFPTRYPREGIPGSILDSYAAGVPVLSSHFVNAPQIIDDMKTGLILDFDNITEELTEALVRLADHPEELIDMREACTLKAADYQADKVVAKFADMLCGKDILL